MTKQICNRCVQDESVPGITFDGNGICNYCYLHDELCEIFPNDEKGTKKLNQIIENIKKQSVNKEFDCIVGISGGRDSIYLLYNAVKIWNLRVLAVHFDDGFDNPIATENMKKAVEKLKIKFVNIKYSSELDCELKRDFLRASTPDLNIGTEIALATALYGVAHKYNIKYILLGLSFRTEGIKPLEWSFFDGKYLKTVHNMFGTIQIPKWTPSNPTYNLSLKEIFFYTILRGIRTFTPLYYINYVRKEVDDIIKNELGWVYPGAHYFDCLYHSVVAYVHRIKFHINLNMNSDAALVRSGQMTRQDALERLTKPYHIENEKVIENCLKKINVSQKEFDEIMKLPLKTFMDYNTNYNMIKMLKYPIKMAAKLNIVPKVAYKKYFEF